MNKILEKSAKSLISPVLLRSKLSDNNFSEKYRLLDVSLSTDDLADYKKGHIEKAIYFDVGYGTVQTERYPKPFPPKELFQKYLGDQGISNRHHLIFYDRSPHGFLLAPRAWWVMRVLGHEDMSILNGGFNSWLRSGYGLTDQIDHYEKENYQVNENLSLVRNYEDIIENIKTKKYQVIDARPKSHFNSINPVLGIPNHIPNSINVQHNELFDRSTHSLKTNQDLKKLFEEKGVNFSNPIIASCKSSVAASSLAFCAYLLGHEIPVYKGSWAEYSDRKAEEDAIRIVKH